MEVQDIFEDLQDPGPVPEEGDTAYKIAIRKLDFYFRVEENIPYECRGFRQLTPQDRKTADQFMARLRKQARYCNFGTSLNDNLRDQLIEKLIDFELKRKLLEQRNITLEEALDKARGWEAAGKLVTGMSVNPSPPKVERDSVNAVKTRQGKEDGIDLHLVVTKNGRCLLGHETSKALGLLRIGLGVSSGSGQCNVVGEDLASALQTKHPEVFVGLGKLKATS